MPSHCEETSFRGTAVPSAGETEAPRYSLEVLPAAQFLNDPVLRQQVRGLVEKSENLNAVLQTPEWIEFLSTCDTVIQVALFRDPAGAVVGFAPLIFGQRNPLKFNLKGRMLARKHFNCIAILGSLAIVPDMASGLDLLLAWIRTNGKGHDAAFLLCVPGDNPIWEYVQTSSEVCKSWRPYIAEEMRNGYSVVLPPSFQAYVAKWDGKSRYNVRRMLKSLKDAGDGKLSLERITAADQVPAFLKDAIRVSRTSWQRLLLTQPVDQYRSWQEFLTEASRTGLLRGYVLRCGEVACAVAFGFRLGEVYVFFETAYDPKYAQLSPGKALIYLLIEDLYAHDRPRIMYFGPGDMAYKEWFSTAQRNETTLFLFKRSLKTWFWCQMHRAFRKSIQFVRDRVRALRKKRSRGATVPK